MTAVAVVLITLLLAGVFAMFWWLVELSGGAAGSAMSVCRSMQAGLVSWRESRGEARFELSPADDEGATPEPRGGGGFHRSDEGFEVPIESVRGRGAQRRF